MIASDIDRVMTEKGLATNPAFNRLDILIQPIPKLNGCPLGLYIPERSQIILPADFSEAAFYHELGHRHGHYYYDNLSEQYAESFRSKYQGGSALLYVGDDFSRLAKFGHLYEEGESGAVEVALQRPLNSAQLEEIKAQFLGYGERPPKITHYVSEVPMLRIDFTKGVDWPVIIGTTMTGIVLVTAGAIFYAIYKVSRDMPWLVPLTILGSFTFLLMRSAARRAVVVRR